MVGGRERGALWAMSLSKPACYWSVCSTGLLPLITSLFAAASDINNSTAAASGWRRDNSECGIIESTKIIIINTGPLHHQPWCGCDKLPSKWNVSVHTESENVAQSQAIRIYLMFHLELHCVLTRHDRVKWQVYKALSFMSIWVFPRQLAVFVFTQIYLFVCLTKIFFKCSQYFIVTLIIVNILYTSHHILSKVYILSKNI